MTRRSTTEAASESLGRPVEQVGEATPFAWRRALLCAAVFACAFASVDLGIGFLAGRTLPAEIERKLDYFEAHEDRFDVVFVGSSLTRRHVDPRTFDRELEESGHRIRSLNLGVLGMTFLEADALLDRILSLDPRRLRWAVIDIGHFGVRMPKGYAYSDRALWWHTRERTLRAIEAAFGSDFVFRVNLETAGHHVSHFLRNAVHLGRGGDHLSRGFGPRLDAREGEASDALYGLGFFPHGGEQSEIFGAMRVGYERWLRDALQRGGWPARNIDRDFYLPLLVEQARRLRASGIEPVYIVPPIIRADLASTSFDVDGEEVRILEFNDPSRYPQLFEFEARYDSGHLRVDAAREYSRLLARRFAELHLENQP